MKLIKCILQIAEKIIFESIVKKEPDSPSRATIVLNATSEFCRALGDIPTYGQAGNREEIEKDELEVSTTFNYTCLCKRTSDWITITLFLPI